MRETFHNSFQNFLQYNIFGKIELKNKDRVVDEKIKNKMLHFIAKKISRLVRFLFVIKTLFIRKKSFTHT